MTFKKTKILLMNAFRTPFMYGKFQNSNFEECHIEKCLLSNSCFENMWFRKCTIIDTDFTRCKFENVQFINCTFENIQFDKNSWKKLNLQSREKIIRVKPVLVLLVAQLLIVRDNLVVNVVLSVVTKRPNTDVETNNAESAQLPANEKVSKQNGTVHTGSEEDRYVHWLKEKL